MPLLRYLLHLACIVLIAALAGPAMRAQGVQSFQSIRLFNPATPAQGITLAPPAGITSYTLTFPATAPVAGTALVSTGVGTTAWTTVPTTVSTLNSNRILVSSAGSITELPALTNGQILIGSTGLAPVAATITAGSGITVTNAAGSITIAASGGLPTGTTNNATLRYNTATSAWTENTNVLGGTDGSLTLGGALGGGTSTATPVSIGLGSSYASDLNPLKAKLILYNDLSNNVIGMGVSLSSFNFFVNSASQFSWRSGSGATPTEIMSLSSSRLTLPSTTDLTIKGVSYTWPTANGAAGTVLTNNGSGTLTWSAASGSGWGLTGNAGTNATNNYIGTTDNVDFVVRTNNVERMRVLSGGNVGIGTTAPAAPLEVRRTVTAATEQTFISLYAVGDQQNHGSTIDFRNDGGGYYASIAGLDDANNDGRLELRVSGNSAINGSRLTSSDARLTIKRTGFVGIGTTAPSQLLTVTNGNVYLDNSGTAGELRFREPSASGANYTAFRAGAQAADLTYTLPLAAPTAGQLLSSDASGNLSWTSAGASGWGLTGNASTNATTNFIGTTDNVDFVVRTFNTERMRVLGGGNVTLGGALGTGTSTATPVTLSLGSTFASSVTASQAKLRIFENSSGSDIYGLGVSSSQLNYFAPTGATHRWYVNNVEIMSLSSTLLAVPSSNMAIGTSSSTERLTVSGNIALTGSINLAGTAGAPGTPSVLAQQTTSGANTWIYRESAFPAWGVYHYNTDDASAVQNSWMFMNGNSVGWSNASFTSIPAGTAASIVLQNQTGNAYFAGNIGINTTAPTARLHVTGGNIFLDNAGTAGELRFREPSASGANYTAFRAGAQAADLTYTLPLAAPTAGQILSSDASGNLSWASAASAAWALSGSDYSAGSYTPTLNALTYQFGHGDKGSWVGTRNAQTLWFGVNSTYRAAIATDGTFTMSGPLVINNLSSTAGTTLPAGYDRILIGNSSGQIEEVSFTTFADATNTGWGINGNTTTAGTYTPTLNGSTVQFVNGDRGSWVGTRNAQTFWFGVNNVYRASIATDGTFTMSGPLVINNLSSTAGTTLPAGYDRILIGNSSGQIEEVSFTTFADATNTGWGINGNTTTAGAYAPSLNGSTVQFVNGDRGSWVGTRNAQTLWFGVNNVYRASIATDGTFTMSGPLVINNLSSAAGTTLPAGYDRILIGNSSGQIEEVSFTTFADATNTGWGINGNTTAAGTYAPSLNGSTVQFLNGDRGPWVGTRNAQPLWFATNNVYRAQLAVDGTFTMSGPLVINNLSSTAGATLPAGYDRILIGNSSGQIEEVSFTTFADATNTGWGINGNTTATGTYAPSLNGSTVQFVNGDRGPWVGTRNAQPLWFGTNNVYRAQLAVDGTFTMSGPLVIDNLNSTASATISAGYDRVLVANSSGRVEEVSFSTFANASASSWGTSGNEPAAGTYSPSLGGNTTQFVSGDRGSWIGTRNARDLWFGTNNVYRAVITSTGELALSGQAQFAAGTAAAPSVSREGDTDNGMFFPAANTLAFSTGATERMRVTDIGRVGIGNAAPAYVLDVTGDINSSTNVRAAGTALTSDLRLKRNIVDIDSALDIVERLVPVRYEKKSTIADSVYQWKQMGFIAQDLQDVLPDLVHVGRDADSTLSVDYTSLVALLTGAVKEQQKVIQDQTQYIRLLNAQIEAIEQRLQSLEQKR